MATSTLLLTSYHNATTACLSQFAWEIPKEAASAGQHHAVSCLTISPRAHEN